MCHDKRFDKLANAPFYLAAQYGHFKGTGQTCIKLLNIESKSILLKKYQHCIVLGKMKSVMIKSRVLIVLQIYFVISQFLIAK